MIAGNGSDSPIRLCCVVIFAAPLTRLEKVGYGSVPGVGPMASSASCRTPATTIVLCAVCSAPRLRRSTAHSVHETGCRPESAPRYQKWPLQATWAYWCGEVTSAEGEAADCLPTRRHRFRASHARLLLSVVWPWRYYAIDCASEDPVGSKTCERRLLHSLSRRLAICPSQVALARTVRRVSYGRVCRATPRDVLLRLAPPVIRSLSDHR